MQGSPTPRDYHLFPKNTLKLRTLPNAYLPGVMRLDTLAESNVCSL